MAKYALDWLRGGEPAGHDGDGIGGGGSGRNGWSVFKDQLGNPMLFNRVTGEVKPASLEGDEQPIAAAALGADGGLPPTAVSPNGTELVLGPEKAGYVPKGFNRAPEPNPGYVISTGMPGDKEWNASQGDAPMAGMAPLTPQETAVLGALSPEDQAAFQRVLAMGDPGRIAEARRRLAAAAAGR